MNGAIISFYFYIYIKIPDYFLILRIMKGLIQFL
jgi:hypothetical protein